MQISAQLLIFAIILYAVYNLSRLKQYIQNHGLLWTTVIGLIYFAIAVWIFSSNESLNSLTLFLGLMTWIVFEMYGRINHPASTVSNEKFFEVPLVNPQTFYDVAAREIFFMREQITGLTIKQDSLGWDKYFNREFIYKMRLYPQYKKHYLCEVYTPPNKKLGEEWGGIIMIIGKDIFGDIINDHQQMDIEKLVNLHEGVEKKYRKSFHKGSFIYLYLEEKNIFEDSIGTREPLRAEIISIKKRPDIFYTETEITLKIDLNSNDDIGLYPGCNDPEPEYITRTIDTLRDEHLFIDDDEFSKSRNIFKIAK
jgi:hypothetical protein